MNLRFGAATANNNLGIVEVWAGDYAAAERQFETAKAHLESLSSNEAYQPISNLAVLRLLRGDQKQAQWLLSKARAVVSRKLMMDDIMLRSNELILNLALGQVRLDGAALMIEELYDLSLRTKDMRFRRAMEWLADQIRRASSGQSMPRSESDFEARCLKSKTCGIEVFYKFDVEDIPVKTLLHLSPHWRY